MQELKKRSKKLQNETESRRETLCELRANCVRIFNLSAFVARMC